MARYLALLVALILGYIAVVHRNAKNAALTPPQEVQSSAARAAQQDIQAASAAATALETKARQLYSSLAEKRKFLDLKNEAAVSTFNWEAREYAKLNAQLVEQQNEVARLTKFQELLQAQEAAFKANASAKKVLIFSTSWCPACRSAKQYFSQKNILFQELDVERSSEAAAEFKRLGGSGVPLILIGAEKMSGFNPEWIEQQLKP